jgi:hypothetical protein
MRLLLGAALIAAGVLAVLVGAGHGGLVAAGAFVLAGAVTAIRGQAAGEASNAELPEPHADAEGGGR